jgi:glutaredoxin
MNDESSAPVLYVKTGCPHSKKAIDYLNVRKVKYVEANITESDERRQELMNAAGHEKVPTLVYKNHVCPDAGIPELDRFLTKFQMDHFR